MLCRPNKRSLLGTTTLMSSCMAPVQTGQAGGEGLGALGYEHVIGLLLVRLGSVLFGLAYRRTNVMPRLVP